MTQSIRSYLPDTDLITSFKPWKINNIILENRQIRTESSNLSEINIWISFTDSGPSFKHRTVIAIKKWDQTLRAKCIRPNEANEWMNHDRAHGDSKEGPGLICSNLEFDSNLIDPKDAHDLKSERVRISIDRGIPVRNATASHSAE
jgi:hypothetical protein